MDGGFMQEFAVEVSQYEQKLRDKGIPILDISKIGKFQERVVESELKSRLSKISKEKPVRIYLHNHASGVTTLCILALFLGLTLLESWKGQGVIFRSCGVSAVVGIAVVLFFLANFMPESYKVKVFWTLKPFSLFEAEYKDAGNLRVFVDGDGPFAVQLRTETGHFLVQFHPFSTKRFLVIQDEFSGEWFYVDSWDEPHEE
jgi:hypothetical protein